MKGPLSFALLFVLSLPALPNMAKAEVCTGTSTPLLQSICSGSETTSAYQNALLKAYFAALRRLSAKGKVILRRSEVGWEGQAADACIDHLTATAGEHPDWIGDVQKRCLLEEIAEQRSFLDEQGRKRGNYVWQDLELSKKRYCTHGSVDAAKNTLQFTVSWSRIDAPENAATDRWNAAHRIDPENAGGDATEPARSGDPCDTSGSFETWITVQYASGDVIQLSRGESWGYSNMPHGVNEQDSSQEFVASGKPLTAADVFRSDSGWQKFIAQRLFRDYKTTVGESESDVGHPESEFEGFAEDISRWHIDAKTLEYDFGSYDLGGYANANFSTSFTWKELRPFLRGDLPFHPDFS